MQHFLKDINPNMCHFRMTCTLILTYVWGFILDFRTTVSGLSKTSVLVLPLGLFDRSRSRTVGPLPQIRQLVQCLKHWPTDFKKLIPHLKKLLQTPWTYFQDDEATGGMLKKKFSKILVALLH